MRLGTQQLQEARLECREVIVFKAMQQRDEIPAILLFREQVSSPFRPLLQEFKHHLCGFPLLLVELPGQRLLCGIQRIQHLLLHVHDVIGTNFTSEGSNKLIEALYDLLRNTSVDFLAFLQLGNQLLGLAEFPAQTTQHVTRLIFLLFEFLLLKHHTIPLVLEGLQFWVAVGELIHHGLPLADGLRRCGCVNRREVFHSKKGVTGVVAGCLFFDGVLESLGIREAFSQFGFCHPNLLTQGIDFVIVTCAEHPAGAVVDLRAVVFFVAEIISELAVSRYRSACFAQLGHRVHALVVEAGGQLGLQPGKKPPWCDVNFRT